MEASRIDIRRHFAFQGGDLSSLLTDTTGKHWLFMLVTNGSFTLKIGDNEVECGPGLIVRPPELIVKPELIVRGDFDSYELSIPSYLIWKTALLNKVTLFSTSKACRFYNISPGGMTKISRYFKTIFDTVSLPEEMKLEEAVYNLSIAFLCYSYRLFHHFEVPLHTRRTETLANSFIKLVLENCQTERLMSFYADSLGVSSKYLAGVVASVTGKSSSKWIEEFAISCARAFLKETRLSINQISDKMSFKSSSDFCKYFRKGTGMSPNEYRKTL